MDHAEKEAGAAMDDDEWQLVLWRDWTVDVPGWLLTRPAVFALGVACGLVLSCLAFLVGLWSAYA